MGKKDKFKQQKPSSYERTSGKAEFKRPRQDRIVLSFRDFDRNQV